MTRCDFAKCVNIPIYVLLDIDKFKMYNTELGYEKADEKLRELSQLFLKLKQSCSDYDRIH